MNHIESYRNATTGSQNNLNSVEVLDDLNPNVDGRTKGEVIIVPPESSENYARPLIIVTEDGADQSAKGTSCFHRRCYDR